MTVSEQERGGGREGGRERESDCAMTSIFAVIPLEFWLPTLHERKSFRKFQCECEHIHGYFGKNT